MPITNEERMEREAYAAALVEIRAALPYTEKERHDLLKLLRMNNPSLPPEIARYEATVRSLAQEETARVAEKRLLWLTRLAKEFSALFDAEAGDALTNKTRGMRNFGLWHDCHRTLNWLNQAIRHREI